MEKNQDKIEEQIKKLEEEIASPDFWSDKGKAQAVLRELTELKIKKETSGIPRYVLCPVPTGAPTHRGVDASSPVFRLTDLDLPDVLFAINMRTRFRCADDRQRGDSIARRPVWDSNPRP